MDSSLIATAAAALPVLLVWAAAVDILTREIPNTVVLLLAGAFGLFAGTAGMSVAQIMVHVVCACAVLTFGFLLFSRSLLGGGDAKLLAAASLWFGFENLLPFLAATALAGGVLSLAYLAVQRRQSWARPRHCDRAQRSLWRSDCSRWTVGAPRLAGVVLVWRLAIAYHLRCRLS